MYIVSRGESQEIFIISVNPAVNTLGIFQGDDNIFPRKGTAARNLLLKKGGNLRLDDQEQAVVSVMGKEWERLGRFC